MKKVIVIAIICNLFLISCNTVRESAGVNRKVIDEYSVIESPPLVIPPNFNLLPPEQIESKNIDDADSELAKEILFGLDDSDNNSGEDNSLISEIVKETKTSDDDDDIRNFIDEEFAGEKSSIDDETAFETEDELNNAIEKTRSLGDNKNNEEEKSEKKKKKKRFFFF